MYLMMAAEDGGVIAGAIPSLPLRITLKAACNIVQGAIFVSTFCSANESRVVADGAGMGTANDGSCPRLLLSLNVPERHSFRGTPRS
jgi:hypothetical protein